MPAPFDGIFTGGQMTDLPPLVLTAFDGNELFEIVSPGNEAAGVNYRITSAQLAALLAGLFPVFTQVVTIVTNGADAGTPYAVLPNQSRVLFNKTVGAASYVSFPISSALTYQQPVLIKDIKGDADINPITVEFTGGELVDGQSQIVISNPYGWVWINPVPGGAAWYTT